MEGLQNELSACHRPGRDDPGGIVSYFFKKVWVPGRYSTPVLSFFINDSLTASRGNALFFRSTLAFAGPLYPKTATCYTHCHETDGQCENVS